jgi:hypothetical protein
VKINITKVKNDYDNLLKKLQELENEVKEKDIIIKDLKKESSEKENKIKIITKTNNKLKKSLNEFSKKIDDKLFNSKYNIFSNNGKNSKNNKNSSVEDEVSQKELDNAMNIIKILRNDNQRLQGTIDNYEKNNKLKDLESINKIKEDENINLEKQIKVMKKELNNYNLLLKKCKLYESQIEILTKENKSYKDNIKELKSKLNNQKKDSNDLNLNNNRCDNNGKIRSVLSPRKVNSIPYVKKSRNIINDNNTNRYKLNVGDNYSNNKDLMSRFNNRVSRLHQSMDSLPSIVNNNNKGKVKNSTSPIGLAGYKKNYQNSNDIIKTFFNQDEIEIINKIFKNNAEGLEAFKVKLCIINKSKEALSNKYNLEIKRYNERIASAQEQIEYLNNKIRESEVNYRVLQTQMNEYLIQKKLLMKKMKKLEENLIEKENILKLNFAGEEAFNEEGNMGEKKNDQNENTEDDGSSKIAKDDESNENNTGLKNKSEN